LAPVANIHKSGHKLHFDENVEKAEAMAVKYEGKGKGKSMATAAVNVNEFVPCRAKQNVVGQAISTTSWLILKSRTSSVKVQFYVRSTLLVASLLIFTCVALYLFVRVLTECFYVDLPEFYWFS